MKEPIEQPTTIKESGGAYEKYRVLSTDGVAAAGELREFIGRMRGKSTQEVLGVIAQSGLVRSIGISTLCFVVLIAVFTVGPYLLKSKEATASAKPASGSNLPAASEAAAPATTPAPAGDTAATAADGSRSPSPTDAAAAAAAAAMGLDETKQAPPNENPLEKNLDNLLDGVK
jgi:cytoskeletal protein RodZ